MRPRLQRLGCCALLSPLRPLEPWDLHTWLRRCPQELLRHYDEARLRVALDKLFTPRTPCLTYSDLQDWLLGSLEEPGSGALERARLRAQGCRI